MGSWLERAAEPISSNRQADSREEGRGSGTERAAADRPAVAAGCTRLRARRCRRRPRTGRATRGTRSAKDKFRPSSVQGPVQS
jgi:hypothetical protein